MKNFKSLISSFCLTIFFNVTLGQDMNAFVPEGDAKYFDFWEGTWLGMKEDGSLDSAIRFEVKRSVNPSAFEEAWGVGTGRSVALRAWDKTNGKWGFSWVSTNGLYQVWDSQKIDGHWYILKDFNVNGDKYLSRQSFILQSDSTVIRLSEKTYDKKKWELRFKQRLKKIRN